MPAARPSTCACPSPTRRTSRFRDGLTDEQVLFLGDIFPTGWQAAVQCDIQPTDTVAIWGCGPVGQMAIRSAVLLGAKQVIAIDRVPERLSMAEAGGAITINFDEGERRRAAERADRRQGPGEVHRRGRHGGARHRARSTRMYDRAKQAVMLETDRPHVLREMIYVCRPAGTLSVPGVYGGLIDKIPFGALMNKGLTIRTGQTHVNRWTDDLLRRIEEGQIDPSFVITHTRRRSSRGRRCTRRSATSRTAASRSCCNPERSAPWRAAIPQTALPRPIAFDRTTGWRTASAGSPSRSAWPSCCAPRASAAPLGMEGYERADPRPTACARSRPASPS